MTIQVIQWMACCLPFPATVVSGCLWLEPGPDDFRDLFHRTIPEDLWYSYSEWWGYKYVNQPEGGRNLSKSCSDKPEKKQLEFTNPNRSLKSHPSLSQELCQGLRAQEATSHRPWDALRSRWEWRDFFFSGDCLLVKCHETEILATHVVPPSPEHFQVFTSCPDSRPGGIKYFKRIKSLESRLGN